MDPYIPHWDFNTHANISHRKQDGVGACKNLTFTNTSEVLFQVLVINHVCF